MIRIVCNAEEKRRIARSILEALTDWFGISEARETYICESADEIMVASFDNDAPNGFLCLKDEFGFQGFVCLIDVKQE